MKGYAAPLDPRGTASLYGPPPWHFHGRMLTVFLRADPAALAAHVPAPLVPYSQPIVRVHLRDGLRLRPRAAIRRAPPGLAHFCETGVSLFVEHDGIRGNYCAFICAMAMEIAVGREMYGWPQLLGEMWLTRPPHGRSWRRGDEMARSSVGRGARCSKCSPPSIGKGPGSGPAAV